ncbi:MAG: tetratricopeptide repeat protein [Deltaproteobacteria bacterium]
MLVTYQLARVHHQAGRLPQAEALYRQILQAEPNHPEALHSLGMLAHQAGKSGIAVELIKRALLLNPEYIEAHYNLGTLLHLLGKQEEAEASFLRVLALKPDFVGAHNNRGMVLQFQGKLEEAEASFRSALALKPDFAEALNNLGNVLHAQGKPDEAEASYRLAVSFKPDYIDAQTNLGIELLAKGKLEEAEAICRRVLSMRPDHVDSHNNLGTIYYRKGNFEKAIASYSQALILRPDYAEVHNNLGRVFMAQGKLDEAIGSYRQALKLRPNYAEAYNNIGLALIKLGRLDEAVKYMQISVENAPGDGGIFDELVFLLNHYLPKSETDNPYINTQRLLQKISNEYTGIRRITDEAVRQVYQQCCNILSQYKVDNSTSMTQLYRGEIGKFNCDRHMMVFNTYNIIPEYCFGCFKVTFELKTVLELFKLLLLFDKLELPNDNPRKCMVELRHNIFGPYKGYIYCQDINDGKEILNIVQPLVNKAVSQGISSGIKRGCSEFQIAYPGYADISENNNQLMSYKEEWRQYEVDADRNIGSQPYANLNNFTNNHSGFTLLDILVMRNWIAYAAKLGDLSYMTIVENVEKVQSLILTLVALVASYQANIFKFVPFSEMLQYSMNWIMDDLILLATFC